MTGEHPRLAVFLSRAGGVSNSTPPRTPRDETYYLRAEVQDVPPPRDCSGIYAAERKYLAARKSRERQRQVLARQAARQRRVDLTEQRRIREGMPDPAIVRQLMKLVQVRR